MTWWGVTGAKQDERFLPEDVATNSVKLKLKRILFFFFFFEILDLRGKVQVYLTNQRNQLLMWGSSMELWSLVSRVMDTNPSSSSSSSCSGGSCVLA